MPLFCPVKKTEQCHNKIGVNADNKIKAAVLIAKHTCNGSHNKLGKKAAQASENIQKRGRIASGITWYLQSDKYLKSRHIHAKPNSNQHCSHPHNNSIRAQSHQQITGRQE